MDFLCCFWPLKLHQFTPMVAADHHTRRRRCSNRFVVKRLSRGRAAADGDQTAGPLTEGRPALPRATPPRHDQKATHGVTPMIIWPLTWTRCWLPPGTFGDTLVLSPRQSPPNLYQCFLSKNLITLVLLISISTSSDPLATWFFAFLSCNASSWHTQRRLNKSKAKSLCVCGAEQRSNGKVHWDFNYIHSLTGECCGQWKWILTGACAPMTPHTHRPAVFLIALLSGGQHRHTSQITNA